MPYAQRFIIGVILIVSAYELHESSYERYHWHLFASLFSKDFPQFFGYEIIQFVRKAMVAVIFTGGLSLITRASILLAILAQGILVAVSMVDTTRVTMLNKLYWIAINFMLLVILIISYMTVGEQRKMIRIQRRSIRSSKKIQTV